MKTIFKKIIDKEIPARIVYEDDICLAFHDIQPQAPIHILVIPKKEIISLGCVESEDLNIMGHLMIKIPEIAKKAGLKDFRIISNSGEKAGQIIFHLHIHLLGGKSFLSPKLIESED